jgi:hypothetical protein
VDDKVWGEKRQQRSERGSRSSDRNLLVAQKRRDSVVHSPATPGGDSLDTLDATHLQFFFKIMLPSPMEEKKRTDGRRLSDIISYRYGSTLNSNPVRAAILLLAYSFKNLGVAESSQLFQYRDQFYQYANDAVDRKAFDELVYSCYAMCLHGFISDQPFGEIACHARSFLISFQELKNSSDLGTEEVFFLRCMCKDLFCWMTGSFRVDHRNHELSPNNLLRRAEKMFELVQLTGPLFEGEMLFGDEPEWIRNSQGYMRIQMLVYRLQIAFEYYLIKLNSCAADISTDWLQPFLDTVRGAFRELDIVITEDPQISSLVDRSHLFHRSTLDEFSPMQPPFRVTKESEWLFWQPALLAHYNYEYNRLVPLSSSNTTPESADIEAVGMGMSFCRMINWNQNRMSKFKMNNLSALRSLMIAFWWEIGNHYPEGFSFFHIPLIIRECGNQRRN